MNRGVKGPTFEIDAFFAADYWRFRVQPEVSPSGDSVTVYGGFGHQEFGPWLYRPIEK